MNMPYQVQKRDNATETVIFRGVLRDDLRFEPVGCYSTYGSVPRLSSTQGNYFLALYDAEERLPLREPVAVADPIICTNLSPGIQLVEGRMPLHADGKVLHFLKEDILIGKFPLAEPPQLSVEWKRKVVERKKKYPLVLQFSKPMPDAHIKILYQWDENHSMTAGLTRPMKTLDLDFTNLPGGDECRLVVIYTSGMRTVGSTTDAFSVPLLPPSLRIVRPREQAAFAPWHPITLEAEVRDRQNENIEETDLVWLLNGKEVVKGRLGCLQSLPEGKYELEVRLNSKQEIAARREFKVVRPKEAIGISPNDWD
jgi:hypothetical protein